MRCIAWWHFQWQWRTRNPVVKVTAFLKSNIGKTARLKDKVTIAQEETISNMWNGTVFGDIDWTLNVSRGFVGISWASCFLFVSDKNYLLEEIASFFVLDRFLDHFLN